MTHGWSDAWLGFFVATSYSPRWFCLPESRAAGGRQNPNQVQCCTLVGAIWKNKAFRLYEKKRPTLSGRSFLFMESGNVLLSQVVSNQVPSALKGLTSVFGMGTGGPPASSTPTILLYLKAFQLFYLLVTRAGIEPALPAWEAGVLTAWPTSLVFRHKG